jgi:hypothetical protein
MTSARGGRGQLPKRHVTTNSSGLDDDRLANEEMAIQKLRVALEKTVAGMSHNITARGEP